MEPLTFTKEQMSRRVARFGEIKPLGDMAGLTGSLPPDLKAIVTSQTVYPLTSPTGDGDRNFWDAGAVSSGTPNFGAVYVQCPAGKGASWHVHRWSYENFIAMKGTWRIYWNAPDEEEHVDLATFDMVSVPPGAIRRFENVGPDDGLLLAFAYSAGASIMDVKETWLPPCEVERIEAYAEGKTDAHDAFARKMRDLSETVARTETEEDRKYLKEVAELIGD